MCISCYGTSTMRAGHTHRAYWDATTKAPSGLPEPDKAKEIAPRDAVLD